MDNINDLIPAEYKNRQFLQGATHKRSFNRLDKYSEDPNAGRGQWAAATETDTVKVVLPAAFQMAVWADMNHRIGVTPDIFEQIIGNESAGIKPNPSLSPVRIHPKNKGKITQMINIILSTDNKGIWIEGSTGRGKTFILESLIRVNNKYVSLGCVNVQYIGSTSYYDISLDLEKSQKLHEIDRCIKGSTFVDDYLYRGESTVNIYGKIHNVAELIIERMHYMQMRGYKMYSTSNFSISDCASNGIFPAIISRMRGMFHVFEWYGDQDFREV